MDQKSSFFICPRVSARFLHCFCTVSRDAMGTLTCKIRQRVQKLHSEKPRCSAQKQRKLESFKIRVPSLRGSFNQRARDSSSLERTKIPRRIVRFLVGFSFFWRSAHLCTLFAHQRESRVFPCIVRLAGVFALQNGQPGGRFFCLPQSSGKQHKNRR